MSRATGTALSTSAATGTRRHGRGSPLSSTPSFHDRASFIPGPSSASPSHTRGGSRMRESRTYGSVRGAGSDARHLPRRGFHAHLRAANCQCCRSRGQLWDDFRRVEACGGREGESSPPVIMGKALSSCAAVAAGGWPFEPSGDAHQIVGEHGGTDQQLEAFAAVGETALHAAATEQHGDAALDSGPEALALL